MILHAPQITSLNDGLLLLPAAIDSAGFNFTVVVSKSIFSRCSATSMSNTGRSQQADAVGGAVFAKSVALSHFSMSDSNFSDNFVNVGAGAGALPSRSSGGAVAVEFKASSYSVAVFSSCIFINCTSRGASIPSTAVTGGAMSISLATSVAIIDSKFTNCKLQGALSVQSSKVSVSGGAGVSLSRSKNISVYFCVFDATDGQDDSATSTGLAIFAASSSYSRTDVKGTSFSSSAMIFSVRCVSDDGFYYVGCPVFGPQIFVSNSNIAQLTPNATAAFNLIGTSLMSFDPYISPIFTRFVMKCSLSDFSVFKDQNTISVFPLVVFSCKACSQFEISLSANEVWLEQIVNFINKTNCVRSSVDNSCPFGVKRCQTFVDVEQGFWTNFSESGGLLSASRCPDRYCGCNSSNDGCPLSPLLYVNHVADSLCSGNRIGVLCGGCRQNFTHSMNGYSCVSNGDCLRDFGWVWTVSVIGFVLDSIYIVFTSVGEDDGFINCVLFFGQMSLYASIPPVANEQADDLETSSWISKSSQFASILSRYQNSCYGPNMGAYAATAAQLIGPLTVFLSSMLLILPTKLLVKKFHGFFTKRNLDVPTISFPTTLMNLLLMLFSSISSVVFQLVTCQDIGQEKVVFIDGTKSCSGPAYSFLVFVAAMLSLVPLFLWAGLKFNKIPKDTRAVLCSPYTDAAYYWVALALMFRFIVSVLSATIRQFPSVSAGVISVCAVCMLMLLLTQRPYVDQRTYYMDVFCHFCLIVQFVLQCLSAASESLGLSLNQNSPFFITVRDASTASTIILYVFLFLFVTAEALVFTRFSLRYLAYSICAGLYLLELGLLKLIQKSSRFQKLTSWMSDYKTNYRQSTILSAIELSDMADPKNELPASVARLAAKHSAHGVDDGEDLKEHAQVTDSTAAVPDIEYGATQQLFLELELVELEVVEVVELNLEAAVHARNQEISRLRGERGARWSSKPPNWSSKPPHISAAAASDQDDGPLFIAC